MGILLAKKGRCDPPAAKIGLAVDASGKLEERGVNPVPGCMLVFPSGLSGDMLCKICTPFELLVGSVFFCDSFLRLAGGFDESVALSNVSSLLGFPDLSLAAIASRMAWEALALASCIESSYQSS